MVKRIGSGAMIFVLLISIATSAWGLVEFTEIAGALNKSYGYGTSMVLVSDTRVYLSFIDQTNGTSSVSFLRCLNYSCSDNATLEEITGRAGSHSMAVDAGELPAFSFYHDAQVLGYHKCADSACSGPPLAQNVIDVVHRVRGASVIRLRPSTGHAVIAYFAVDPAELVMDMSGQLRLAVCQDVFCTPQQTTVVLVERLRADADHYMDMRLMPVTHLPLCAYKAGLQLHVNLFSNAIVVIDNNIGAAGGHIALHTNSLDQPVLAFYSETTAAFTLVVCSNSACTNGFSTNQIFSRPVRDVSLVLAPLDIPIMSYYDIGSNSLGYVVCNDKNCAVIERDLLLDGPQRGSHTSIQISSDQEIFLAYQDFGSLPDTAQRFCWCDNAMCNVVTQQPSTSPSQWPTSTPTQQPSSAPTQTPSRLPSSSPTTNPTVQAGMPTKAPTTKAPSATPSAAPSSIPTNSPSADPTSLPSKFPSANPTATPSKQPSMAPSSSPSMGPTSSPSLIPSQTPTALPSAAPTLAPTTVFLAGTILPGTTISGMVVLANTIDVSMGTLMVSGTVTFAPSSIVTVSNATQIQVTGQATLGGHLVVQLTSRDPTVLTVLTASSVSGAFHSINASLPSALLLSCERVTVIPSNSAVFTVSVSIDSSACGLAAGVIAAISVGVFLIAVLVALLIGYAHWRKLQYLNAHMEQERAANHLHDMKHQH